MSLNLDTDLYAHRRTQAQVQVRGVDGTPLTDHPVRLEQRRHHFGFGCTAPDLTPAGAGQSDLWLDLFDTATLTFYWGRYEPEPGRTDHDRLLATAHRLAAEGVRLKGHPLVWHTIKPSWADELPLPEAEQALRRRIRREVSDFAGLIDSWDVINEVVIMPIFDNEPDGVRNVITRLCEQKGRVEMVRMAVDEARAGGTSPTLLINDFDLGVDYERLLDELLAAGVQIDAIGLQSHMHKGFRGEEYLIEVSDRFQRFGLPLHWTETTLLSGELMPEHVVDLNDYAVDQWPSTAEGEQRQAEEIVRHYRTLVAHPAVESITYWGFDDARAWLGAPCGLIRRDGSPKPAYSALRSLIRDQWWLAPTELRTDDQGRISVDAFAGSFLITSAAGEARIELPPGQIAREVVLTGQRS